MDIFDSHYFKINKFILSCVGQWVFQPVGKKRFARTLIILSLSTTLIPQINFLLSVWGDLDAMIECLPPLGVVLISASQACVFTYNQKKLLSLANSMKRDWKVWSSGKELEILQIHAEEGRIFTLVYIGNFFGAVFFFVSMSLSPIVLDKLIPLNETRPRQLVYAVKFPFNQDKYFDWILVHGTITSFYNMTILFSCEAMLAITTQHACGLFSIISYRFKNIVSLYEDKMSSQGKLTTDEIYKEMSSTIYWHNQALEYAKTLQSCYSPFLFFTVAFSVMNLSISGIQTVNALGSMDKTIKYGTFCFACFIHLYCISLPAQNLEDSSIEITNEVYSGCWYLYPLKSRKLLILIIGRSQIPCQLTAGNICIMGMVSFSSLLQTSLSYFTVLSSVR